MISAPVLGPAMPHPLRVLITNDQEWSLRSLESVLAPLELQISRAFTCAQALHLLEQTSHDLLFLDTNLPDGDGIALARTVRERGLVELDVPVLMTTSGHVGRKERLSAYEAGAWDYLAEPFDGALLMARVRTYLAARTATLSRAAAAELL